MYYENKFISMVNEYRNLFASIFHEYKSKCSGNDSSFSDWQNQRKQIESKLAKEIGHVAEPYFKQKLQSSIQYWQSRVALLEPGCNFDKFCYYIDRINKEKFSDKIVKYNKEYCSKVIMKLAEEYVRILNYIEKNAENMSKFNSKEYVDARQKIINLWQKMQQNYLNQIINDEYVAVINEITSKVK